jgi:molybdenum cofactor cytidylyltransferase
VKLSKALDLTGGETVAFSGAGGKTSAMAALAQELKQPVVMTTTTHLGGWQTEIAGQHHILSSPDGLRDIDFSAVNTTLLTGPLRDTNRLTGLDPVTLDALFALCRERGFSLLIEADGARQCPLKAPAEYEPVIPMWVDLVVVIAGLSGLGKPLDAQTVHRPEIFAQLADLEYEEVVRAEHLARVLVSPSGGLKGIPGDARRMLFLNQAETEISQAQGARLASGLSDVFDRVLVGSLEQPGEQGPIFSAHSPTAGIILAAGGSERLGQPKQLLDWCGIPFVVQVAQTALLAGLDPVIVVTGANQAKVEAALRGSPVKCVDNPDWAIGQSTSMKAGLETLPPRCDRVMFLLSDQPQISPLLLHQIIERHNAQRNPITAPMIRERRGNPVLFGKETFEVLRSIHGDKGGRAAFDVFKVDHVPWIDDRCLMDIDQSNEIAVLKQRFFGHEQH